MQSCCTTGPYLRGWRPMLNCFNVQHLDEFLTVQLFGKFFFYPTWLPWILTCPFKTSRPCSRITTLLARESGGVASPEEPVFKCQASSLLKCLRLRWHTSATLWVAGGLASGFDQRPRSSRWFNMAGRKQACADNPLRPTHVLVFSSCSWCSRSPFSPLSREGSALASSCTSGHEFSPSVNEAAVSSEVSPRPRLRRKCLHFADADLWAKMYKSVCDPANGTKVTLAVNAG